jgi:hypothetical protein
LSFVKKHIRVDFGNEKIVREKADAFMSTTFLLKTKSLWGAINHKRGIIRPNSKFKLKSVKNITK